MTEEEMESAITNYMHWYGLTIREVNQMLRGFRGLNFLGADIVCFCPPLR